MIERDSDLSINCDTCNKPSGYTDNTESLHKTRYYSKPTWRCPICVKTIKDEEEGRFI